MGRFNDSEINEFGGPLAQIVNCVAMAESADAVCIIVKKGPSLKLATASRKDLTSRMSMIEKDIAEVFSVYFGKFNPIGNIVIETGDDANENSDIG